MRTYLVVAHRTLAGWALLDQVAALGPPEECHLHLVVPVHHPSGPWSDGQVEAAARVRLDEGLATFRGLGYEVSGEVGDANPVYAATTAVRNVGHVDGVLLSTLPRGVSKWLHLDAVSRLRRELDGKGIPVTHVTALHADAAG
jgi:hypothetical protein